MYGFGNSCGQPLIFFEGYTDLPRQQLNLETGMATIGEWTGISCRKVIAGRTL